MTKEEAIRRIKEFGLHHAIGDLPHSAKTVKAFDMAIEALQADAVQGWIPCSERLPSEGGFYLCTTEDCVTILEFITGNYHFNESPSFVSDTLGRCNGYVIAWMPLPKPWKGADDDRI